MATTSSLYSERMFELARRERALCKLLEDTERDLEAVDRALAAYGPPSSSTEEHEEYWRGFYDELERRHQL